MPQTSIYYSYFNVFCAFKTLIGFLIHDNLLANSYITTLA